GDRRRGAPHQRRQVRQEGGAGAVRVRGHCWRRTVAVSIRRGGKATARGWIARILAAAAVVAAVAVPAARPAHAATGTFTRYTDLALPYWVYVPSTYTGSTKVPLVVYLHGCNQSPPDAATGTRLNALAEAQGFIV